MRMARLVARTATIPERCFADRARPGGPVAPGAGERARSRAQASATKHGAGSGPGSQIDEVAHTASGADPGKVSRSSGFAGGGSIGARDGLGRL